MIQVHKKSTVSMLQWTRIVAIVVVSIEQGMGPKFRYSGPAMVYPTLTFYATNSSSLERLWLPRVAIPVSFVK